MTATEGTAPGSANRVLCLARTLDAPRESIYRCWTEPGLLTQWFTPAPWTTPHAELDVRPGGTNRVTMRSPEGQNHLNAGVYLEVVPNKRLVITDAYTSAWVPSDKPFMTLELTLADAGPGKTAYTARVLHWTAEDREQHERMGFHEGWGLATSQLEKVAQSVAGQASNRDGSGTAP